jgi:hypothetical protein
MKPGFHVCLYKRKGHPIITAYVQGSDAEISISLEDFISEVKKEIGSITWTFRKETFEKQLDLAVGDVISNIKKSATQIV